MQRRTFLAALGAAGAWAAGGGDDSPVAPRLGAAPMKVLLWCWDARMTWDDEPDRVAVRMAAAEQHFPYLKGAESYQVGFRRLVDYCAANGVWGVIIWGFLRDAHGGVAAARDLCHYARDRGVAIVPGVGLCAYGGYYYHGDHPFNLDTYLRRHPDRASVAREEGGGREVRGVLDPSLAANRQWWREGLEWMLENFEIAGIDYEMGDFIVNPSESAKAARAALGFDTDENILDIVVATRELMDHAHGLKPDGTFINALYRGYHQIRGFPDVPYAEAMHPGTVWQYTLTRMVREKAFSDGFFGAPAHRQYGYLHWFNISTMTQDKDYVPDIARVFPAAHALGFEFIGTYGEVRADTPTADRNYRAQVAWAKNPALCLDDFR